MMIQVTTVSALATAIGIALSNYRRSRQSRHREQILIQGLHQANISQAVPNRHLVSVRQSEMEGLLENVRIAADGLLAAFAAEKEASVKLSAAPENNPALFEEWSASRRADEQAHEDYDLAIQEYREFIQSLAPPLRAKAAKRADTVMILARA
jgi:hypothetical protein